MENVVNLCIIGAGKFETKLWKEGNRKLNYTEASEKLKSFGQEHLLRYFDELSKEEQEGLLQQIEETDFSVIEALANRDKAAKKGQITPTTSLEIQEIEAKKDKYESLGIKAIQDGKVGAVLLAGGMGTRLGSNDPKGVFDIGISKPLYIFECLIGNLMEVVEKTGAWIPLFVMTSEKNHDKTVSFFKEHEYFGYRKDRIWFFKQEMAPAVDENGKVLLEEKGRLSTSPNGNGGWFVSLSRNGLLDVIHQMGIEWLNIFAVDNVLQKIADPVFVGAVMESGVEAGSKVVRKASPDEKVGVMCLEDGRPSIVEYYELTDEMREEKNEKGDYAYNFGVILNYLFSVSALERIMSHKLELHVVKKQVTYLDEAGRQIKPEEPNAYKFEQLVLDMIHDLKSCLPFEVIREKEFAPIKNATGVDSVETARELLKKNGVQL